MARRPARPALGVVAVVAALVGSAAVVAQLRERRYPPRAATNGSLSIQSAATLQRLTKGYNALAADLYWIRAIQYYGGERLKHERSPVVGDVPQYPLLYPLLDLTTSLDPYFNITYRFGSVFLAEAPPGGPGRPDQAIALLEKALKARPDKWEYMQDIGFVHYWWTQDYGAAANWFDRAASVPGAPWFLRALAATTRAQGGDLRTSRAMWQTIHETAELDWLRDQAERSLTQIDAMEFMAGLQERIDQWILRSGVAPANWNVLISEKVIPGIPVDPTGVGYELDRTGAVVLSPKSPLYPLPQHPTSPGRG